MDFKSHSVNLMQKRKAPNGQWQFYPVHWDGSKPNPRLVVVESGPTSWKEGGAYFIDQRVDGKRVRRQVGKSPREALDAWRKATAVANGSITADELDDDDVAAAARGVTIKEGIRLYLEAVKATKGSRTYVTYEACLRWAKSHLTKTFVSRLTRNDLLALFAAGREEGLNQKTINRHVTVLLNMVRHNDCDIKLKRGDWPKTVEKRIEVYTEDQIRRFFAACTEEESLLFQVFLCTGFRDKEVAHLKWSDIDFRLSTISVSAKPELKFTPKSYEVRAVHVPRVLIDKLKRRHKSSTSQLVFPSPPHPTRKSYGGGVDKHMLVTCKKIALRAGLNCGYCEGAHTIKRSKMRKQIVRYCCKRDPKCENWFLHKWRHTYASHMIGVLGLKGLQLAMGHKDISTTSKYLHFLDSDGIAAKVEASSLAQIIR